MTYLKASMTGPVVDRDLEVAFMIYGVTISESRNKVMHIGVNKMIKECKLKEKRITTRVCCRDQWKNDSVISKKIAKAIIEFG